MLRGWNLPFDEERGKLYYFIWFENCVVVCQNNVVECTIVCSNHTPLKMCHVFSTHYQERGGPYMYTDHKSMVGEGVVEVERVELRC